MPAFDDVLTQLRDLAAPFKEGLRATYDAAQQDYSDISQRRLPRQAIRTLGDVASAYQNPSMGTYIPNVPTYVNPAMEAVKTQAQRFLKMGYHPDQVRQYVSTMFESIAPEAATAVRQSGQYLPASQALTRDPYSLWAGLVAAYNRALFSGSVVRGGPPK